MSLNANAWTCPTCTVTEHLDGHGEQLDEARRLVQAGHGERHAAEARRTTTVASALLEAAQMLETFRVRVVVAPGDLERVRAQIVRRSLPIEVYADPACRPGYGYAMQPRRGVRELSTPGGKTVDNPVTPR